MFKLGEIKPFAEGIIYEDVSDEEIERLDFPPLEEIHFNAPDTDIFKCMNELDIIRMKYFAGQF